MQPIHIFRAGRHTSANGASLDFSEDTLRAAAAAYNPALHEAPIVVGHPKDNGPAYGWIGALAYDETGLQAAPTQVDADFAELVKAGRFKKVSASFYTPDSPANPTPGTYYLRHVGFLGAQPPAIKGLKAASFAEGEEGVVEFSDGYVLASFFRRMREWVIEKFGADEADKVLPSYMVQDAEDCARREAAEDAAEIQPAVPPTPNYSEESSMTPEQIQALEKRASDAETALSALQAREASFAEREAAVAATARAQRQATLSAAVDSLVTEGKVMPAQKPGLVAFLEALPAETVVEFGEGDQATKQGAEEYLLGFLKAMPKAIEFGERGAGQPGSLDGASPDAIAKRAVEYREAEEAKGHKVSTADAVAAVIAGAA